MVSSDNNTIVNRKRAVRLSRVKSSAYWEGKMYTKGQEQGKLEAHKHKPLSESLKEHIGKMIDNAKLDPIEIGAIGALAFIIKPMVNDLVLTGKILNVAASLEWSTIQVWFWPLLGNPPLSMGTEQQLNKYFKDNPNDLYLWLISFVAAFCIIRWGDKMLNAGIGSLLNIAGLMGILA